MNCTFYNGPSILRTADFNTHRYEQKSFQSRNLEIFHDFAVNSLFVVSQKHFIHTSTTKVINRKYFTIKEQRRLPAIYIYIKQEKNNYTFSIFEVILYEKINS